MIKTAEIIVRNAKGEAKIEILDEAADKMPTNDLAEIIHELLNFALEENPVELIIETGQRITKGKLTIKDIM